MKLSNKRCISDDRLAIGKVIYSEDGHHIVGGGGNFDDSGTIGIWSVSSLELTATVRLQDRNISTLHLLDNGRLVACGYFCDCFEIWDIINQTMIRRFEFLPNPRRRAPSGVVIDTTHVGSIDFSDNPGTIVLGCWDCSVKVVALDSGKVFELLASDRSNVDVVSILPKHTSVIGVTHQHVYEWDYRTRQPQRTFALAETHFCQSILLRSENSVFSLALSGDINILHLADWTAKQHRVAMKKAPALLAYSERSKIVAIGHNDGTITFISTADFGVRGRITVSKSPINSIAFAPNRDAICIVAASEDNRIIECEYSDL